MPRHFLRLPAVVVLAFFSTTAYAVAAEKSRYECRNGSLVRRVIIEVGDINTGLPCEVVYWKDTEAPGVRRVLWNARSDVGYCETKAAGLVDKLSGSGWQCERGGEAVTRPAAVTPAEPPAVAPAPAVDAATVPATPSVAPSPPAEPPAVTQPLQPVTPQPQTEPPSQTAALAPPATTPARSNSDLNAVIEKNLGSLNQSVDGNFQAELGQFGDLNQDGLEDAVVFFNYETQSATGAVDVTQFVAAYLFNGESYHLAATKPVGGTDRAVRKVEIENIVDGSILLKLQLNDASQTEDRRAAMVLKDGQLVEIE